MAMKYIHLQNAVRHVKLKWEWALEWEENRQDNLRSGEHYPGWNKKSLVFSNRAKMRSWKSYLNGAAWCRNVVVKRRLVQVNWEDYNDSFTYNAGCGMR